MFCRGVLYRLQVPVNIAVKWITANREVDSCVNRLACMWKVRELEVWVSYPA